MIHSHIQTLGPVPFPAYQGERVYMERIEGQLPSHLARWQDTVDAMLKGIPHQHYFLMIDETPVKAGAAQRRPGLHIDGWWDDGRRVHGTEPAHVVKAGHQGHGSNPRPGHNDAKDGEWPVEAIILASTVAGCRGYIGSVEATPGVGGAMEDAARQGLGYVDMQAGIAYAGNVTMLHESLPINFDCQRSLVRLNVPGWAP